MRYFSSFSGIGGMELGIGNKHECVGYSEIDKYAISIYEKHFKHKNYGNITKIKEKELPDFDLFVGGFPCQSFSIAGQRKGFDDTRGTLFFDICRILKQKQPRLILLENVRGLLSHDKGRTFTTIISSLDELGYDLQWQVLNSQSWVPQNRERVYIVGHLRGTSRPQVFPFGDDVGLSSKTNASKKAQSQAQVASTIRTKQGTRADDSFVIGVRDHGKFRKTEDKANAIDASYHKGPDNHGQRTIVGTLRTHKDGNGFREIKSGLAPTIPARAREDGSGQAVILQKFEGRIRRLTPTECARLQGFPDDWHKVEGVSDTQAYKCYGNAVTVDVVREIMKKLLI